MKKKKIEDFQKEKLDKAIDLSTLKNDNVVEELTLTENIMEQSKEPVTVAVLYILLSHPIVTSLLNKYIKYVNIEVDGKITTTGLLIKGLIIGLFYYLVKKFLLK